MFSRKKDTKIEKRAPINENIIILFVFLLILIFLASFKEDIIYAPILTAKSRKLFLYVQYLYCKCLYL